MADEELIEGTSELSIDDGEDDDFEAFSESQCSSEPTQPSFEHLNLILSPSKRGDTREHPCMILSDLQANDDQVSHIRFSDTREDHVQESNIKESDIQASDIQASDIQASDIQASDIQASDIQASDIEVSDIGVSDILESDSGSSDTEAICIVNQEHIHYHSDTRARGSQVRYSQERDSQTSSLTSSEASKFKKLPLLANYFTREKSNSRTNHTCLSCLKVVKSAEMRRLTRHIIGCSSTPQKDKDTVMNLIKQPLVSGEYYDKALYESFTRVIVENNFPLHCVESPSLREFINLALPNWRLPSRVTLTNNYIPLLSRRIETEFMGRNANYLTIEFDHWRDLSNRSLFGIVISQPDGRRYVFDLIDVSIEGHTSAVIVEKLVESLKPLKLRRVNSIISDSASSCKSAREDITKLIQFRHVIQHRCLAHLVNRIGVEATKSNSLEAVVKWASRISSIISNSSYFTAKIRLAKRERIKSYCPVRWYSQVDMLESIIRAKRVIVEEFKNSKTQEHRNLVRFKKAWDSAFEAYNVYKSLAKCVAKAERRDGHLGEAFKAILDCGRELFKQDWTNAISFSAITAYITYINPIKLNNSEFGLLIAAYTIDPRYGQEYLTNASLNLAVEVISELALKEGIKACNIMSIIGDYERFKYDCKKFSNITIPPDKWWLDNRDYPNLKPVALRLANLSSSSANIERTFSTLKYIQGSGRFNMSLSLLKDLGRIKVASESKSPRSRQDSNLPIITRADTQESSDTGEYSDTGDEDIYANHLPSLESRSDLLTPSLLKRYKLLINYIDFKLIKDPQTIDDLVDTYGEDNNQIDLREIISFAETARTRLAKQ